MPAPKEEQDRRGLVLVSLGAIAAALIGLSAWQPRATIWSADPVEAERSAQLLNWGAPPVGVSAKQKRTPIVPGEWVRVFEREEVVQSSVGEGYSVRQIK